MCLLIERFDVNAFGALIEVGRCGHRRMLRGRTVDDVAREDAAELAQIEATISDLPDVDRRAAHRPCEWPGGCSGFTASSRATYCTEHCKERRRQNVADYCQRRRDNMRRLRESRRSTPSLSST